MTDTSFNINSKVWISCVAIVDGHLIDKSSVTLKIRKLPAGTVTTVAGASLSLDADGLRYEYGFTPTSTGNYSANFNFAESGYEGEDEIEFNVKPSAFH